MKSTTRGMTTALVGVSMVMALALGMGCKKKGKEKADTSGKAMAPMADMAAAMPAGMGMEPQADMAATPAPAGKSELRAKADKVIEKCKWSPKSGFSSYCQKMKDLLKIASKVKKDGKLVKWVESKDPKMRFQGAFLLRNQGGKFSRDKDLAQRLVAAAEKETDKAVAGSLGQVVAKLQLVELKKLDPKGELKLKERVKKIAAEHKLEEMRAAVIGSLLWNNGGEKTYSELWELTAKIARKDASPKVREAAQGAYWTAGSKRAADTCKLWLENCKDAQAKVAARAAYYLSFWSQSRCKAQWAALQTEALRRAKAGLMDWNYMSGISYLQKQKEADAAVKKKMFDIARKTAKNPKNPWMGRTYAMSFLHKHKAPGVMKFLKGFTGDKESLVANKAKELLKKKPGAK